jgi:hypothetical protein
VEVFDIFEVLLLSKKTLVFDLLRWAWKTRDPLDLEVREAVHELDLVVGETVYNLPFAGGVRERCHLLNLEVGKAIDDLYLVVRKGIDDLDFAIDIFGFRTLVG